MTDSTPCPALPDRVVISVNPKAGAGSAHSRVERLAEGLRRLRLEVEILSDLDLVAATAQKWHAQGRLRALVAVGGDGTAAELVNRTEPGLPVAVFPTGTSNLLARQFRIPFEPEAAARAIAAGRTLRLDAASASGRVFLLMLGCGFDAEVVQRLHQQRLAGASPHIRYASYFKPILHTLRTYGYPEIRIDCEKPGQVAGQPPEVIVARWAFVCNLPRYGWGIELVPEADGADGLLDLCTYSGGSWWDTVRFALGAQFGWHRRMAGCATVRGRKFRLTAAQPVPYELDGDPGGMLPVDIEVLPGRVTLIVP